MDEDFWQKQDDFVPEKPQPWGFYALIVLAAVCFVSAIALGVKQHSAGKTGAVLGLEQSNLWQRIAGKTVKLDSSTYDPQNIILISNFEKTESWQGNAVFDDKVCYQGKTSLGLVSTQGDTVSAELVKNIDLSAGKIIELAVNTTNRENIESFYLDFGSRDFSNFYRYTFTNLSDGWDLWQMEKEKFSPNIQPGADFDWSKVAAVRLTMDSRPETVAMVRTDLLQAIQNPDDYLKNWDIKRGGEQFLGLTIQDNKPKLVGRGGTPTQTATLKNTETSGDFSFIAGISPQASGRNGLFFGDPQTGYGYYFLIFGKENRWQIKTKTKALWSKDEESPKGEIAEMLFSPEKAVWLKIEKEGGKIVFYCSKDKISFAKLGEIDGNIISTGSAGITVLDSGWSIFDNFEFKGY